MPQQQRPKQALRRNAPGDDIVSLFDRALACHRDGRLAEAEEQFRRALQRAPANGWSYYGLAEVYKARRDAAAAAKAEADLARTWVGDRALLQVGNL